MTRAYLWFIGPVLFLMVAILILPIIPADAMSFTNHSLGGTSLSLVGIENH